MSSVPQLTPSQLNFAETAQWKEIVKQALADLRVSIPAIVQSFDAANQTVSVKVALREVVRTPTGPENTEIDAINLVPVVFPSAGGFSLTLPIQAGDEGMLVFCDMCIDLWWKRSGIQDQFERRRHHLSDCGFYPGGRSEPRKLSAYSEDTAQLRSDDGTTYVEVAGGQVVNIVAPGGVNINGNVAITGTLMTTGDAVIDGVDIKTHRHSGVTTGGGTSGPPL